MNDRSALLSPEEFATKLASKLSKKADHNKNESLIFIGIVVVCSLASPLFVTLGDGLVLGKIIPSILSLSAAASTTWLQIRKPQNLWTVYRDCQRKMEDHIHKYQYKLDVYDIDDTGREKKLAEAAANIAWEAHQRWMPLVPTPETIGNRTAGASSSGTVPEKQ